MAQTFLLQTQITSHPDTGREAYADHAPLLHTPCADNGSLRPLPVVCRKPRFVALLLPCVHFIHWRKAPGYNMLVVKHSHTPYLRCWGLKFQTLSREPEHLVCYPAHDGHVFYTRATERPMFCQLYPKQLVYPMSNAFLCASRQRI